MVAKNAKRVIQGMLSRAGIEIDGDKPWDIKVHNPGLYSRVLAGGSLAFGEAYMDGWWDAERVDELICKLLSAKIDSRMISPHVIMAAAKSRILNMQTLSRSKKVTEKHYDLGNRFYEAMLDKNMQYTCAYWKGAKDLDEAQEHKLKLICRKLQLKRGETVLELGCGWGGFAKYAAETYGVHVTAYNISREQVSYAREKCKGLPVKIIKEDYRKAKGKFDKIVSIGLCEHVGYKNHRTLMRTAHKCLKRHGLFVLHTIGKDISVTKTDPWIDKYIFPNSMLPSVKQLSTAAEKLFVMEDWHNFGTDYDKTLMAWHENFEKSWDKFRKRYGKRFYRMWNFYLLSCAGLFRARRGQLWQIVLSKDGIPGGYESKR